MFKGKVGMVWFALLLLVVVLFAAGCGGGGQKQTEGQDKGGGQAAVSEADFFKGKVLTFVVPYSPGGGYDAYARMMAPYIEKYTGSTVVVKNVPGGGSLTGTLEMYRSKPDGLTISIVQLSSMVLRALQGETLEGLDLGKVNWLARVTTDSRVIVAGKKSGFTTFEQMRKAGRPIKFSAAGVGSSDFYQIVLAAVAAGLDIKVATAYEGSSEQDLALIRGDVEGTIGSYMSKLQTIKNGDMIPILQFGEARNKDMPDVPMGTEVSDLQTGGKDLMEFINHQAAFDRVLAAPPGIPAARLEFLRQIISKALNDPELIALGEKQERYIIPAEGKAVESAIKQDLGMPDETKAKIKQAIEKYK